MTDKANDKSEAKAAKPATEKPAAKAEVTPESANKSAHHLMRFASLATPLVAAVHSAAARSAAETAAARVAA